MRQTADNTGSRQAWPVALIRLPGLPSSAVQYLTMSKSGTSFLAIDTDELTTNIYEGVTRADAWRSAMQLVSRGLNLSSAMLGVRDVASLDADNATPSDEVLALSGVNPTLATDWATYRPLEPAARIIPTLPPGCTESPERLGLSAEIRESDYFVEFAKPLGAERSLYAWAPWPHEGILLAIAFHREERYGPFDDHERRWSQKVVSHLVRAAKLRHRLHDMNDRLESSVLRQIHYALVAVDDTLRARWMNEQARRVLANPAHPLRLEGLTLTTRSPEAQPLLTGAVRATLHTALANTQRCFALPYSASTREPVQILVAPLKRRALALVVIDDVKRRLEHSVVRLSKMFALTPAEAGMTLKLALGHSIKEAASLQGISEGTARNYVKSSLAKTGSRRQAALVRLVLSPPSASWLRD